MRGRHLMPLALLVAACGGGEGRARDPFTPAVVASASTSVGATPMFAVSARGDHVLSWVAPGADSVERLHVEVRGADGGTVSSVVSDPLGSIEPHGEAPPQVVIAADGTIYGLYTVGRDVGKRFPESALRLVRSDDGGRTWSDPVSVNEGEAFGSHNFHALLAGEDGSVHATWLSNVQGRSGVMVRSSTDGGRHWSPTVAAHDAPACPCCRTGLARDAAGRLYASWRKVFDGDVRDVAVIRSDDGGTSWSEPVRPRADGWVFPGCPHAGPSLKVRRNGVLHIAWWTGKAGEAGVWYARSTDQGVTWQAQPLAIGEESLPAHAQLALTEDGRVVVVYDDGLGERPRVMLRASADDGRRFGPALPLSDPALAATFPVLAIVGDSVHVAWSQMSDAAHHAAQAERPDMDDPAARMPLPRVGQQEVLVRKAAVRDLVASRD